MAPPTSPILPADSRHYLVAVPHPAVPAGFDTKPLGSNAAAAFAVAVEMSAVAPVTRTTRETRPMSSASAPAAGKAAQLAASTAVKTTEFAAAMDRPSSVLFGVTPGDHRVNRQQTHHANRLRDNWVVIVVASGCRDAVVVAVNFDPQPPKRKTCSLASETTLLAHPQSEMVNPALLWPSSSFVVVVVDVVVDPMVSVLLPAPCRAVQHPASSGYCLRRRPACRLVAGLSSPLACSA